MNRFQGSVAIVTGGTRDIGRSCSILLAEARAKVVVNNHSNRAAGEETVAKIEEAGGTAILVEGDMTRKAEVDRLVVQACDASGESSHVLVHHVGGLVAREKLAEVDEVFVNQVMRTNVDIHRGRFCS
ncbi:3-oxoacyl-[acyl-carrier protein] reductase [Rhodopirellula islandica]|uniref:3-oxoacyl-[acyl-carrier protein] reductase n=1 Tax=Rhodopirellula islandica TaxID=595434 RepID=A0A0J1BGA3_RHOIS|nr:SDR family NAD(P)-dependent oxidoreductase [Rhodopirellula islandica]KLU05563.1 3-oxoacyl-[acyl-carrier protein] reductase [Rhodopirellula islandica]